MIRTDRKAKLPRGLSYPIGAQKISEELGDIPQAESTLLRFEWRDEFWVSSWRKRLRDLGVVTLVEASYWDRWDEWRLYIYAVPSEYNVASREYLLSGALRELGAKLKAANENTEHFNERITFHLREAKTS